MKKKSVKKTKKISKKPVKKIKRWETFKAKKEIALKNLFGFILLFLLFLVLNVATKNVLLSNFFKVLEWTSGFLALAFLILFLVLWFLKLYKK